LDDGGDVPSACAHEASSPWGDAETRAADERQQEPENVRFDPIAEASRVTIDCARKDDLPMKPVIDDLQFGLK
jgi:hypothetical protein